MRDDDLTEAAHFPVGARVRLEFQLEDRQRLDLQGEVRWRRDAARPAAEAGLGIQFVDMREEQRHQVEDSYASASSSASARCRASDVRRACHAPRAHSERRFTRLRAHRKVRADSPAILCRCGAPNCAP